MTDRSRTMLMEEFPVLGAVDTTCHLGQWPFRLPASAAVDDLRDYARWYGLRSLWVSHLASLFGFDTRTGNEAVFAACGDDPLFRVFAVIDPRQSDWRQELAWAALSGAAGIRVAPGYHRYPVSLLTQVVDACAELELPLQLLTRLDDARVRHPLSPAEDLEPHHLADLIRARPAHPMLLSGLNHADWQEVSRHLGDDAPSAVRLDLWHVNGPTHVADGLARDPGRWVFGSGYPVQTPEATMLQLAASALSGDVRGKVCSGNAVAMLAGTATSPGT